MRSDADQLNRRGIGKAVDQNEIRLEVAVPMVVPISDQGMIPLPRFEGQIGRQAFQDGCEIGLEH